MAAFEDNGSALEEPTAPRGSGFRLAEFGSRLTRPFTRLPAAAPEEADQGSQTSEYDAATWEQHMPRFAMVRHGYHCAAVDQYIAELEQELGELDREVARLLTESRSERPAPNAAPDAVAAEIKRVGEQTSEVLIAAHRQAQQTTQEAEAQARQRLDAAESEANAMVAAAKLRLCQLEDEMMEVHRERARLLGDVRSAATALSELVDVSFERFPPELDQAQAEPEPESEPASDNSAEPV